MGLGCRYLGFRGLGFRGLGFRGLGLGCAGTRQLSLTGAASRIRPLTLSSPGSQVGGFRV